MNVPMRGHLIHTEQHVWRNVFEIHQGNFCHHPFSFVFLYLDSKKREQGIFLNP